MIAPEDVTVVLLAAGLSSRFAPGNKLRHPLGDLPLGLHAARTLAPLPFAARIAVVGQEGPDFSRFGFEAVLNMNPAAGQSSSVKLGVEAAMTVGPRAILIVLADMPFVPLSHFTSMLAGFGTDHPIVASTSGAHPCPPALFDASFAPTLTGMHGDTGARSLLRDASLVHAAAAELRDIDVREDLADS